MAEDTSVVASHLLERLRDRLTAAYGDRLHAVVLFGSEARGEARPDSDIDLLAVLETPTGDYGDELEQCLAAVYPIALRLGRRVSVKPLTREEFEQGDSPFLREVRRSGVAARRNSSTVSGQRRLARLPRPKQSSRPIRTQRHLGRMTRPSTE